MFWGCRKEVLEIHPEMEGTWTSENYKLSDKEKIVIKHNGDGSYERTVSSQTSIEKGEAKISNNVLKIGKSKFKIIAYPAYDSDGNYYLVTDKGKFFGVYGVVNPQVSTGLIVTFLWTNRTSPSDWVDDKQVDYKQVSEQTWHSRNGSGANPISLTGFQHGTYQWRIKSNRGPNSSQYTPIQTQTF
jgi:hypothetical protein